MEHNRTLGIDNEAATAPPPQEEMMDSTPLYAMTPKELYRLHRKLLANLDEIVIDLRVAKTQLWAVSKELERR